MLGLFLRLYSGYWAHISSHLMSTTVQPYTHVVLKKKEKWPRPYRRAIQYPIEAFEVPMHDVHSTKES